MKFKFSILKPQIFNFEKKNRLGSIFHVLALQNRVFNSASLKT